MIWKTFWEANYTILRKDRVLQIIRTSIYSLNDVVYTARRRLYFTFLKLGWSGGMRMTCRLWKLFHDRTRMKTFPSSIFPWIRKIWLIMKFNELVGLIGGQWTLSDNFKIKYHKNISLFCPSVGSANSWHTTRHG